jgi:hypothetical protein
MRNDLGKFADQLIFLLLLIYGSAVTYCVIKEPEPSWLYRVDDGRLPLKTPGGFM